MNQNSIQIETAVGDVREFRADVLVLKYAQYLYGADKAVYDRLTQGGVEIRLPNVGEVTWCRTNGHLGAPYVLFIGVNALAQFGYAEIRDFGVSALQSVAKQFPQTGHVALTLHGPGYGLDEIEAFRSELAGVADDQRRSVPERTADHFFCGTQQAPR